MARQDNHENRKGEASMNDTENLFEYLKYHYEINEMYCSICLERQTLKHWLFFTCEGKMLSREEMEHERTQRRTERIIVYDAW